MKLVPTDKAGESQICYRFKFNFQRKSSKLHLIILTQFIQHKNSLKTQPPTDDV